MKSTITLTDAAATRIKALLAKEDAQDALGIKLSVNSKGCSGFAYDLSFATDISPADDVVEDKGVKVVIDPAATFFILGSEMDYVESDLKSGFEFNNPNEAGRCGCGESFYIERDDAQES